MFQRKLQEMAVKKEEFQRNLEVQKLRRLQELTDREEKLILMNAEKKRKMREDSLIKQEHIK